MSQSAHEVRYEPLNVSVAHGEAHVEKSLRGSISDLRLRVSLTFGDERNDEGETSRELVRCRGGKSRHGFVGALLGLPGELLRGSNDEGEGKWGWS